VQLRIAVSSITSSGQALLMVFSITSCTLLVRFASAQFQARGCSEKRSASGRHHVWMHRPASLGDLGQAAEGMSRRVDEISTSSMWVRCFRHRWPGSVERGSIPMFTGLNSRLRRDSNIALQFWPTC
jgi:hypothetical protein